MPSPPAPLFDPFRPLNAEGLVAVTAGLDADMLQAAYRVGVFPWQADPVAWYAPPQRALMPIAGPRLPRNLPRLYRMSGLQVSCDSAFDQVMAACRDTHLLAGRGAWIDASLIAAYGELARRGMAHGIEIWEQDVLVGGVYGVQLGRMFAAESMFHRRPNASKFALGALGGQLRGLGVTLWDVQVINPFTRSLGAFEVGRQQFARLLAAAVDAGAAPARWPTTPLSLAALEGKRTTSPPASRGARR